MFKPFKCLDKYNSTNTVQSLRLEVHLPEFHVGKNLFAKQHTDLNSLHLAVRGIPKWEHLPQRDSETPHVTGVREMSIVDALRSVPVQNDRTAV